MSNININTNLKNRIMRRVYAIWFYKKATSPIAIQIELFVVLLFWLSAYVSVGNVIANASDIMSSPVFIFNFLVSAFESTEAVSKILLLIAVVLSAHFLSIIAKVIFGSTKIQTN